MRRGDTKAVSLSQLGCDLKKEGAECGRLLCDCGVESAQWLWTS